MCEVICVDSAVNTSYQKRARVVSATAPPSTTVSWIRTNRLPVGSGEGTLVAATYNGERYWESLPPALSTAPLYQRPVGFLRQGVQTLSPTRCISAPPSGPIPLSATTRHTSLIETLTRPDPIRRVSAPTPSLFSLAASAAASLVRRTSVGDSSDVPSLISGSGSTVDSSSVPPSPATTSRTIVGDEHLELARFAQRSVQNGKFGEWTTEKKDILCAYFLVNDFPDKGQREALGRQVKLEVGGSRRSGTCGSILSAYMRPFIDAPGVQVLFPYPVGDQVCSNDVGAA